MKQTHQLAAFYAVLVIVKVAISLFVPAPTIFSDEYIYVKAAQNIYYNGEFSLNGIPVIGYPPLYSFIISAAHIFSNMETAYNIIKIINAILSSLIIIPAYLLSREFLDNNKARTVAMLIGIMPFNFSIFPYAMSENLFSTLFLLAIYCIFKSITEKSKRYAFLAGIFLGLVCITRYIGGILFLVVGILIFYFLIKREKRKAQNAIIIVLIGSVLPIIWEIRNYVVAQSSISTLVSSTILINKPHLTIAELVIAFLLWIIIHSSYLILTTGIIPVLAIKRTDENATEKYKMFFMIVTITVVNIVLILSRREAGGSIKELTPIPLFPGRIIGRYLDFVLPLILLAGIISIVRGVLITKKRVLLTSGIIGAGFLIFYYPLFPFNNTSATIYGALKVTIEYITTSTIETAFISVQTIIFIMGCILAVLWTLQLFYHNKAMPFRTATTLLFIFFITSNMISISMTIFQSNQEATKESVLLGQYLNNERDSFDRIIIDQKYFDVGTTAQEQTKMLYTKPNLARIGFWTNKDIVIIDPIFSRPRDYIITSEVLNGTMGFQMICNDC